MIKLPARRMEQGGGRVSQNTPSLGFGLSTQYWEYKGLSALTFCSFGGVNDVSKALAGRFIKCSFESPSIRNRLAPAISFCPFDLTALALK